MNIFLCATSFHVLLAHAIREQLKSDPAFAKESHLVLTGPAMALFGNNFLVDDFWSSVSCLGLSFNVCSAFFAKNSIEYWVNSRFNFSDANVVDIFVGNDTDVGHQVFISSFGAKRLHLFEDGIGSYVIDGWSNAKFRRFVRNIIYRPLIGKSYFNPNGLSATPADSYFALGAAAFPRARSLGAEVSLVHIGDGLINERLRQRFNEAIGKYGDKNCILISEPLYLNRILADFEEIDLFVGVGNWLLSLGGGCCLVKRHPSEPEEFFKKKLGALRKKTNSHCVLEFDEHDIAIEAFAAMNCNLIGVGGVFSSSLLNIKRILPYSRVASGFDLMPKRKRKEYATYRHCLSAGGVEFI